MRNSGTEKKYKQREQNNGTTPDRTKGKVNKEKECMWGWREISRVDKGKYVHTK